jgi:uncharacterized protein
MPCDRPITSGFPDGLCRGKRFSLLLTASLPAYRGRRLSVYVHRILTIVAERKDPLDACTGFDWGKANAPKNSELHQVTHEEAEDVSFHEPLVVRGDVRHSRREKRYYALGQTSRGRYLFVAFTIRRKLIRVISVRDMNRREQEAYGKHEEETS